MNIYGVSFFSNRNFMVNEKVYREDRNFMERVENLLGVAT